VPFGGYKMSGWGNELGAGTMTERRCLRCAARQAEQQVSDVAVPAQGTGL
jgi:hypothetical protein